jgi:hypothetical protein
MSDDIYELFVGKERFKKERQFEKELLRIEEEYIDFFKSRPPKYKDEEHDRLHNHYLILGDNNILRFGFENESELPYELIIKCNKAFNDIFKEE